MAIRVPQRFFAGFRSLLGLDAAKYDEFLDALRNLPLSAFSGEDAPPGIFASIEPSVARGMTEALVGLQIGAMTQMEQSASEAGKAVASQLQGEDGSVLSEADRTTLSQRVAEIANIPQFSTSVRALSLLVANERNFLSGRVVTDMRPVFATSSSMDVSGLLFLHHLQLHCTNDTGHEDLVVTLDRTDVDELIKQLTRAQNKEKALRTAFASSGVRFIETSKGAQ